MERSAVLRCFKFISPTHTRYTQIISSLTQSKSWMKPGCWRFRVCCYACGHGTRRFDPVYDKLRCDEANETFSIDVTGSNRQFCAFMKPQTRTVIRPTPESIIYITKCVIFWYMFCTILVVMLIVISLSCIIMYFCEVNFWNMCFYDR